MVVKESVFRDLFRLVIWYPVRWLIILLPVRAGIRFISLMGDAHYLIGKGKRALLEKNLDLVSGGKCRGEYGRIIREYLRNHYVDRLLILIFPRFGALEVRRNVEISGLENIDDALRQGRGAVIVHGHFGPVHMPLVALARLGYRMKQIGMPTDEGLSWIGRNVAFRLRMRYEGMMPVEIIKADSFLRPAFKWLGSNGIVMITGDGTGTERKVGRFEVFDFLGHKAAFPLGPAALARKTGAALIPMFIVPAKGPALYKIVIGAPLDMSGDDRDVTARFLGLFENFITQFPGYMHFLDRFHEMIEK